MSQATYLSYVANAATAIGQDGVHDKTLVLYSLLCHDPLQQRPVCVWDERIAAVAQARCDVMLAQGAIFKDHLDAAGRGPNKWLRDAGIPIPDYYSHYPGQQGPDDHENNVESIGLNYATAALCWAGWLASPDHRTHCLGEETFGIQTQVGIGYAAPAEAKYPIFWVAITCPPEAT